MQARSLRTRQHFEKKTISTSSNPCSQGLRDRSCLLHEMHLKSGYSHLCKAPVQSSSRLYQTGQVSVRMGASDDGRIGCARALGRR